MHVWVFLACTHTGDSVYSLIHIHSGSSWLSWYEENIYDLYVKIDFLNDGSSAIGISVVGTVK